jgi:hypothetical protein
MCGIKENIKHKGDTNMPSWVKGKKDEELWDKAKAIVTKEYKLTEKDGEKFWKLVTGVYKKSGGEVDSNESTQVAVRSSGSILEGLAKVKVFESGSFLDNFKKYPDLTISKFEQKKDILWIYLTLKSKNMTQGYAFGELEEVKKGQVKAYFDGMLLGTYETRTEAKKAIKDRLSEELSKIEADKKITLPDSLWSKVSEMSMYDFEEALDSLENQESSKRKELASLLDSKDKEKNKNKIEAVKKELETLSDKRRKLIASLD